MFSKPSTWLKNDIFLFLRMVLIFWKEAFAMAILFLFSVLHLPSDVNVYHRYLNFCTCLICSPLLKSLHFGLFFFLDTTIHSVFFPFIDNPSVSLSSTTIFRSLCKSSSDSANREVSSAYHLRLFRFSPFALSPSLSSKFLKITSLYMLNRSGDIPQPCLTPLLIFVYSLSSPSTLTAAV